MIYKGTVHMTGVELSFDMTDIQLLDELSKSIFGIQSNKLCMDSYNLTVGEMVDKAVTGAPKPEFKAAPRNSTSNSNIELAKAIRILRCGIRGGIER